MIVPYRTHCPIHKLPLIKKKEGVIHTVPTPDNIIFQCDTCFWNMVGRTGNPIYDDGYKQKQYYISYQESDDFLDCLMFQERDWHDIACKESILIPSSDVAVVFYYYYFGSCKIELISQSIGTQVNNWQPHVKNVEESYLTHNWHLFDNVIEIARTKTMLALS